MRKEIKDPVLTEVTIILNTPGVRTIEITGIRGLACFDVDFDDQFDLYASYQLFPNPPTKVSLEVEHLVPNKEDHYYTLKVTENSETTPWDHDGHKPVQHRDGNPPWCNSCRWTSPIAAIPAVQIGKKGK